ncbi:MAG: hypothetical protein U0670_10350 [Anaerolineae bacterium]
MNKKLVLLSFALFTLLLVPLLVISAAPSAQQGGRLSGTATALAGSAGSRQNQRGAQLTAIAATMTAMSGQIGVQSTAYAATAHAAATRLHSAGANAAATATALVGTLQAAYNDLPTSVIAWLDSFDGQVAYDYDQATGMLTVSTYLSEAYVNQGADAVAMTLGYSGDSVTVDLQSPDIAIVTVIDPASGATIVITVQVSVVNGLVSAVPLSLTINGRNTPVNQIPAEYSAAANAAVQSQLDAIFAAAGIDYTLQSIYFDDGGATLTVTLSLM